MVDQLADAEQRARALDPEQSFIVQAPAGSGKTSLLMQRFLVLLAGVEAPENIIAVTFTRKAAAEMRTRIIAALRAAQARQPLASPYQRQTRELAEQVLARDQAQAWRLLENPRRLRIQTIDALCNGLANRMPLLSRTGGELAPADDADRLYQEAVDAVFAARSEGDVEAALKTVLAHRGNNLQGLRDSLVQMLASRANWLPDIGAGQPRAVLEAATTALVSQALATVAAQLPLPLRERWRHAVNQLNSNLEQAGRAFAPPLAAFPDARPESLSAWRQLVAPFLKADNNWRQSFTVRDGVLPPGEKGLDKAAAAARDTFKQQCLALLADLQAVDGERSLLRQLIRLPDPAYADDDWQVLAALFRLLHHAVAQLQLLFAQRGVCDHSETAFAARRALGGGEQVTDLALMLDYRIQHLLVDEFQDTSYGQYDLFQQLTAGWQPGDGHTFFAVGDPMQSIYRFRNAEVSLFLDAAQSGLGQLPLEPLTLSANFRSCATLVDWFNTVFARVFPATPDRATGAVVYAPGSATQPDRDATGVYLHAFNTDDDDQEERQLVDAIHRAWRQDAQATVAILVRGRNHLRQVFPALRSAGIPFNAIEIEHLADRPEIQDLLILTRCLLSLTDRVAWAALLRAPWCGLRLCDLEIVATDARRTIAAQLQDEAVLGLLSEDGRQRVVRLQAVLRELLAQRRRLPLADAVERLWLRLGGAATLHGESDEQNVQTFFDLLQAQEAGVRPDLAALQLALAKQRASTVHHTEQVVQVMSMHKAKGLQFDVVLLPGLAKKTGGEGGAALRVGGFTDSDGVHHPLVAPMQSARGEKLRLYDYLADTEKARAHQEQTRLLYVAATRAISELHLFLALDVDSEGAVKTPSGETLLGTIWPGLDAAKVSLPVPRSDNTEAVEAEPATIRRFAPDWQLPALSPALSAVRDKPQIDSSRLEFEWAGAGIRHVGTVTHRVLQRIGEGVLSMSQLDALSLPALQRLLAQEGVPAQELPQAASRVQTAVQGSVDDPRGCWILDQSHPEGACELALSSRIDGEVSRIVIDRTFVDQGTRWIIDYKTSRHEGGDLDTFLDAELARYRKQLERYARIMSTVDSRPIRLGLYFPLLQGWREWAFVEDG